MSGPRTDAGGNSYGTTYEDDKYNGSAFWSRTIIRLPASALFNWSIAPDVGVPWPEPLRNIWSRWSLASGLRR